jgi:hypothetical protein
MLHSWGIKPCSLSLSAAWPHCVFGRAWFFIEISRKVAKPQRPMGMLSRPLCFSFSLFFPFVFPSSIGAKKPKESDGVKAKWVALDSSHLLYSLPDVKCVCKTCAGKAMHCRVMTRLYSLESTNSKSVGAGGSLLACVCNPGFATHLRKTP